MEIKVYVSAKGIRHAFQCGNSLRRFTNVQTLHYGRNGRGHGTSEFFQKFRATGCQSHAMSLAQIVFGKRTSQTGTRADNHDGSHKMVFKNVRKLARLLYHDVHSLARIKTTRRGSEEAAGEIFHRIEHGEEADNQDGEKDNDHVGGVDADGIGVDDEVARRAAEAEKPEGLLEIANQ